jgi:hypothetical protein
MCAAEMPLHHFFSRTWIPRGQGLNDRLVLGNRLTPRDRVFEVLSKLETQRGMTSVEEFRHNTNQYAIASFFGDVEMKCSIRRKVGVLKMQVGSIVSRILFNSVMSASRICFAAHSRRFTFNGDASAHDLQRTLAGNVGGKRPQRCTNKNASSGTHFHHTFHFERNKGLPHRRTGNLQLLSQLPLGRQSCPYRQRAFFDIRPNLERNLLVEASGLNDSKSHGYAPAADVFAIRIIRSFFLWILSKIITQKK